MPLEKSMTDAAGNPSAFGPEQRLTGAYLAIALLALFVGVVTGLFQALSHAGINLYPQLTPVVASYYQGLTLHGVMNALVWTTFFISASSSSWPRAPWRGHWRAVDWRGPRTDL